MNNNISGISGNNASAMPNDEILYALADFFKLMGDTTRCKLLFAIHGDEKCVNELAQAINMTKSSVSHQLNTLRRSGIVRCRKQGKEVYYRLDDEHIKQVIEIGLEHIEHKDGGHTL